MTFFNKKKSGFTLIELLVVISIISILSSVVMSSLATARKKAEEATILQQNHQVIIEAESIYSKNGNFIGLCSTAAVESLLKHLKAGSDNYYGCDDNIMHADLNGPFLAGWIVVGDTKNSIQSSFCSMKNMRPEPTQTTSWNKIDCQILTG